MVVVGILGRSDSGKTLALTYLAYRNYLKKRKIFSNYNLEFPHNKIKFKDVTNLHSGIFVGDDFFSWYERNRKNNRILSEFFVKARKRDVDIFYVTDSRGYIPVLIRQITDFWIYPQLSASDKICILDIRDYDNNPLKKIKFRTTKFFGLYDTHEIIKKETEGKPDGNKIQNQNQQS